MVPKCRLACKNKFNQRLLGEKMPNMKAHSDLPQASKLAPQTCKRGVPRRLHPVLEVPARASAALGDILMCLILVWCTPCGET